MIRRSQTDTPEKLRAELVGLLQDFENVLESKRLREKVRALIPVNHLLRDLGSSLIDGETPSAARDRILAYFRQFPRTLLEGDELMVVAGISEYARRIRELRVEFGWPIISGKSLLDMSQEDELPESQFASENIRPDTYYLAGETQDREAAFRWKLANDIRKKKLSVQDKILEFLRQNVGKPITGEELKYLAKNRSEWARRVRELRTEKGWPVATRNSGSPALPVGVYVLQEDRQTHEHDRKIPDPIRIEVLERDEFKCRVCGWNKENANPADTIRSLLELHHITPHVEQGPNEAANLITLCNVCHDATHKGKYSQDVLKDLISG